MRLQAAKQGGRLLCTGAVWGALLFAAGAMFLCPATAMAGVAQGLALCCNTIIPTLFPFLVLAQLLLESPLAEVLGLCLRPYTRLLGLHSRRAPAALLCGLLGGFAAGAKSVDALYRAGELSADEAQRLLLCTIGSGPAFIVGSVGGVLLGSVHLGWLLLASQVAANLVCTWAMVAARRCTAQKSAQPTAPARRAPFAAQQTPLSGAQQHMRAQTAMEHPRAEPPARGAQGFTGAVAGAVGSVTLLCGYITLFSFFSAIAVPPGGAPLVRFLLALPLEVTCACAAGASAGMTAPLLACSAALSLMGASVFLQVRALVHPALSLRPLLAVRLLHLPVAAALLGALVRLFPASQPAGATLWPSVVATRMPADVICLVFVLCALVFGGAVRPVDGLRQGKKRV